MKKNLSYYLKLNYTVCLKENADGSYFAEIKELPGCMTEGDTKDKAFMMIKDARKAWIEIAIERGMPIPGPSK